MPQDYRQTPLADGFTHVQQTGDDVLALLLLGGPERVSQEWREKLAGLSPQHFYAVGFAVFGEQYPAIRSITSQWPRGYVYTKDDLEYLMFNILGAALNPASVARLMPATRNGNRQQGSNVSKMLHRVADVFGVTVAQLPWMVNKGLVARYHAIYTRGQS